ncbi:UBP-type zinc finger domain-containing protein [Deminuibacter soli]|uniref:UBP-type domain-containing protein n=1 Tax=Deminuibacter soli TaxID=2291815 RepID=A0A3E1NIK3_9BACT|nr:UBP-type zinc finger domain-containing protein [Deminuibacter soli]RFM27765.1 hypothetical protein DXN05_13775 [Deminuibacter soli]
MAICEDIQQLGELKQPKKHECEICVKNGGRWVHLRTCQTCGVTLCCDDSPMKHMSAHFHATGHPVIISAEPGEKWIWCYAHESFAGYE